MCVELCYLYVFQAASREGKGRGGGSEEEKERRREGGREGGM